MKIHRTFINKATIASLALLPALLALFPSQAAGNSLTNDLYLEASPAFLRSLGTGYYKDLTIDYAGLLLAANKRWQKGNYAHKALFETGFLHHFEQDTVKIRVPDTESAHSYHEARFTSSLVPLLATYNIGITVRDPGTPLLGEWRIGPTLGALWVNERYSSKIQNYTARLKDITYVLGVGTGFAIHFTKKFYMDLGYRFLRTGNIAGNVNGNFLEKGPQQMHLFTLTFAWNFDK